MAEYRTIKMAFWTDPFIESLSPQGKLLYIYLFTSPNTSNLGVLEVSKKRISYETGLLEDEVEEHLSALESAGKLLRDGEAMWVTNFIRNQTSTSPKMVQSLRRLAQELSSEVIKTSLLEQFPNIFSDTLSIPNRYPIDTLSIPIREEEEEEEEEMEEEMERKMEKKMEKKMEVRKGKAPSPDGDGAHPPKQRVPYGEILELYHQLLPTLPNVQKLTDQRKRAISARWSSDQERQSLFWWRSYFGTVANTPFLLGRNERNWAANFDFLMREQKMVMVLEGRYQSRQRPRNPRLDDFPDMDELEA